MFRAPGDQPDVLEQRYAVGLAIIRDGRMCGKRWRELLPANDYPRRAAATVPVTLT